MSKNLTVTLYHVIIVYNDIFDHMDGVMRALAWKKAQWKEELFSTVKLTQQKLTKYYAEVTAATGKLLISAHILDHFWKLRSFRKWDKGMDINPEDETSYITQYQEAFLKWVENEYSARHRRVPVNQHDSFLSSNPLPSTTASRSCQLSFYPFELSSDDEEYLTPNNVAETTPGWSDCAAQLFNAARLSFNSAPEATKNWRQIDPNLNDYNSEPMEICSTLWILDLTDWWRQNKETHPEYADLSNVASDIFSMIPHCAGLEASCSLGRGVIGWRQSETSGETLGEKVVVRQFAQADHSILVCDNPVSDTMNTENDSEIKKEVKEWKLHRMAMVHDFVEMWQGSQNLRATQKETWAQNKRMTAVGSISDTEVIIKAPASLFLHDGAASFKLSERSPLPPGLSGEDLPWGRTQILNVCRIQRVNHHPVESDEENAFESVSDSENRLNGKGDLDNTNDSEDNCAVGNESHIEHNTGIEDQEYPQEQHVSAVTNVPRLVWLKRMSKRRAPMMLVTVNAIETRRNQGVKKE